MLYKLSGGSVAKNIGIGSLLLIRNTQSKEIQCLVPDNDSITLLTDLLNVLWPTACKVGLKMDHWPACLWPSTLMALIEWMRQKKCHSVSTILHLATHSSRHLIRAIQDECLREKLQSSFSEYMVQQILARHLGLQVIESRQCDRRFEKPTQQKRILQDPQVSGSPAQTIPAKVAMTKERNSLAADDPVAQNKGRKRQQQTANPADECKRQKVLGWLDGVQKHSSPTSICKVCNRRGKWCIVGSVTKQISAYVALYKRNPQITTASVNNLALMLEALQ